MLKVVKYCRTHPPPCLALPRSPLAPPPSSSSVPTSPRPRHPPTPLSLLQWVTTSLLPHGERVVHSHNSMVELPHALYEIQDKAMKEIVRLGSENGQVASDVHIVLAGIIQINTPPGTPDYVLPRGLELHDNCGQSKVSTTTRTLHAHYAHTTYITCTHTSPLRTLRTLHTLRIQRILRVTPSTLPSPPHYPTIGT